MCVCVCVCTIEKFAFVLQFLELQKLSISILQGCGRADCCQLKNPTEIKREVPLDSIAPEQDIIFPAELKV